MTTALEALRAYRQADADGVMVLVSRQACDECAAEIERLRAYIRTLDGMHLGRRTEGGATFIDEGMIVADDVLVFTGEQDVDK